MIQLILQLVETEEQAFAIEYLFKNHYKRLVALANNILHNVSDAEDVAQDVFSVLGECPDTVLDYDSKSTLAYISLCCKHMAIDFYRKNRTRNKFFISLDANNDRSILETIPDESEDLFRMVISDENKKMVKEALDKLDNMYRLPLLLKYYYNMRNIDIATTLKLDGDTLNGRIFRGKKMLQKILLDGGYTHEKI